MFKYTKQSLKKLETLFEELHYTIRYEKGNFQSGYCVVESRRMAVVNRFFDTEGRINCLLDILATIPVPQEQLSPPSAKFFRELNRTVPNENEATEPSK